MKLLITGDRQLDATPLYDVLDKKGKSTRFQENVELQKRMHDEAIACGARGMIDLGDLSEQRNPPSLVMQAAAWLYRTWLDTGREIVAISGNHECKNYEISSSTFAPLKTMAGKGLYVAHGIELYPEFGEDLLLIPYQYKTEAGEIKEGIAEVLKKRKKDTVACMHYGVSGSVSGPNNIVMKNDLLDWGTLNDLEGIAIGFAGHIHTAQTIHYKNKVVAFPGSPVYNNFGEINSPKGYILYDTQTKTYEWKQLTQPRKWVQVTYPDSFDGLSDPWPADSIVKVIGTVPDLAAARKDLLQYPTPFYLKDAMVQKSERATRGDAIEDLSIQQAVDKVVDERCQDLTPEQVNAVKAMILDHLLQDQIPVFGKDIQLLSVEAEDLLTFRKLKHTFTEELTLLSGENGVGKTNFGGVVMFCLTGESPKKLSMAGVVHRGQTAGWGKLVVGNEHGHTLTISRSIKKNKKGATQSLDVIWSDGESEQRWSDGGVKETQERLNAVLGMSYASLKAANFLVQDDKDPFIFAEPSDRKRILGDMLNQAPLQKAAKVLKEARLVLDRSIAEITSRLISNRGFLDGVNVEALTSEITGLAESLFVRQMEAENALQEFSEASASLEPLKVRKAGIDEKLAALMNPESLVAEIASSITAKTAAFTADREADVRSYKEKIAKKESLLKGLAEKKTKNLEDLSAAQALVTKLEGEESEKQTAFSDAKQALNTATSNASILHQELGEWTGREDTCPECGNTLDPEHKAKEIARCTREMLDAEKVMNSLQPPVPLAQAALHTVQEELRLARMAVMTLSVQKSDLDSADSQVAALDKEVTTITESGKSKKTAHEKEIAALSTKKAEHEAAVPAYQKQKASLDTELAEVVKAYTVAEFTLATASTAYAKIKEGFIAIQESLVGKKESLAKAETVKQAITTDEGLLSKSTAEQVITARAEELMSSKSGLPVYLVDAQLPFLESRANTYLASLGYSHIQIQMLTVVEDKETLEIAIDDGKPDPVDIRGYSGGQLKRVEICLKQALADLLASSKGTRLQFLFYDEPTHGLDAAGTAAFLEFLYARQQERFRTAIVISHEQSLLQAFGSRLVMSGDGTESELSVG